MRKKKDAPIEEISLDDSYLVAFFSLENSKVQNPNFEIQAFLKPSGKVSWKVKGLNIIKILEKFHADELVPVATFIKLLKQVRSDIFLYKQLTGKNEETINKNEVISS